MIFYFFPLLLFPPCLFLSLPLNKCLEDAFIHLGGSIYSMGGPNGNQTLKWCNVSVGPYQWNRRGPSNNPPHFPQVPTSRGEKQSERMSPEKAVGNLCCNICQDVVTCWCWNTTGSKVLLLFKWLVSLIWLISKFIRCCWKLTRCHSTATFLYTHCANSDFYSLGIGKYRLRRRTFPQLMPGIPSSGSCNCPVVFFLSGSCESSGLWRHSQGAIKSFVPGTEQQVFLLAVKAEDSFSCQCLFLRWPPPESAAPSEAEMSGQTPHLINLTGYDKQNSFHSSVHFW